MLIKKDEGNKSIMMKRIFFIVTCGRSGSTSLSRILDKATNAHCASEPQPALYIESRELLEGKLINPYAVIAKNILPRVASVLDQNQIYGEKQLTLNPFIPYLYNMLNCKFIWIIRDGRDVVTSMLNWHDLVYGNIYRECREKSKLSKHAKKMLFPKEEDLADYARPRPGVNDPWSKKWKTLSRLEMIAWYWAYSNNNIASCLDSIPKEDWLCINYSQVNIDSIKKTYNFLGLEGFDEKELNNMLQSRINSVHDVTNYENRHPYWKDWSNETTNKFNIIAGEAMKKFGYYSDKS